MRDASIIPDGREGSNDARSPISLSATTLASHTPRSRSVVETWEASTVGSHTRTPDTLAALLGRRLFRAHCFVHCNPLDARHLAHGPLTTVPSRVELHQTPPQSVLLCLNWGAWVDISAACSALLPTSPTGPVSDEIRRRQLCPRTPCSLPCRVGIALGGIAHKE
ncbi:hypothetical protein L209DRAFT_41934 [Thermothelomyces heterothallicus CBS 203.75]